MKTSSQIRQDFFDFFERKGHRIVASAPVIPYDDPTLLFTNAGMNQFKDVFLGTGKRDFNRCANTQKCIRVSGKHNDLEEVGHDGYHHTFFEMLGNWSFGDYYKKEAISWAWELLTGVWQLPKERLWATVYKADEEAFGLWKSETGILPGHVLKFGEKDNFWEMGETGPCGPCSEIHIDLTYKGCRAEDVNSGNPGVIELWNLVFIQFNRDSGGKLHELPMKHIDTGMGFERLVRVLQGKNSNYETDVFLPMINELIDLTGKDYNGDKFVSSMNVVADHIRALVFAIADGSIPSNEGRGYVLRRILRRAARYGRNLDMHKPFIHNLVDVLASSMGKVFPEINEKKEFIKDVVEGEEEGFNETLDRGLVYFNEELEKMEKSGSKVFSGEVAFKLHDTYGFPVDLTQLMAREKGHEVDTDKFDELMREQKERARSARDIPEIQIGSELSIEQEVKYNPYEVGDKGIKAKILKSDVIKGNGIIVLDTNPFYSESGGQVSDTGSIDIPGVKSLQVIESGKDYVIVDNILESDLSGREVIAKVDYTRRQAIQRNHTATHLVHEALRRVLGSHVKQMGSYLDDKFLRFDFPHFHKLKPGEIKAIEDIVNGKAAEKIVVYDENLSFDKANRIPNVKKLFGEKYGDMVRVVFIDEKFSVEFCGGTHVKDTSDIGLFKIIKEESISSGMRRIFALTGEGIPDYIGGRISEAEKVISALPDSHSSGFRSGMEELRKGLKGLNFRDAESLTKLLQDQENAMISLYEIRDKFLEERKKEEKQAAKQSVSRASAKLDELIRKAQIVSGIKLVSAGFEVETMDELKEIGDALRLRIGSGVGLLYSSVSGKANIVAVVSDDLIREKRLNAGKIAGDVAKILGGGGGGKPHLATAGGKDVSKLDEAVSQLPEIVKKYL